MFASPKTIITIIVAAALLSGCGSSHRAQEAQAVPGPVSTTTSAGERIELDRSFVRGVEFDSGVWCYAFHAAEVGGVSCDFSALEGQELDPSMHQIIDAKNIGELELAVLGDDVCVVIAGHGVGGIDCMFS